MHSSSYTPRGTHRGRTAEPSSDSGNCAPVQQQGHGDQMPRGRAASLDRPACGPHPVDTSTCEHRCSRLTSDPLARRPQRHLLALRRLGDAPERSPCRAHPFEDSRYVPVEGRQLARARTLHDRTRARPSRRSARLTAGAWRTERAPHSPRLRTTPCDVTKHRLGDAFPGGLARNIGGELCSTVDCSGAGSGRERRGRPRSAVCSPDICYHRP